MTQKPSNHPFQMTSMNNNKNNNIQQHSDTSSYSSLTFHLKSAVWWGSFRWVESIVTWRTCFWCNNFTVVRPNKILGCIQRSIQIPTTTRPLITNLFWVQSRLHLQQFKMGSENDSFQDPFGSPFHVQCSLVSASSRLVSGFVNAFDCGKF